VRTTVDVHNYLVARDIAHEMVSTRRRVRSPDQIAGVLGLEPEGVARVVLHESAEGLVAAIVRADRSPDPKLVAAAAGRDSLEEVTAERATELTEFLSEAMPPVALPEGTAVIVDQMLTDQPVLYFPGGEPTAVLKIRPPDLLAAAGAHTAEIS
jgi:prolyl-tRNA editing enzyme YbaK/EbsC (Cys-tRNA(Pro) deacylase)